MSRALPGWSGGVVKDDAQAVALTRDDSTHAVAHADPIGASRSAGGAVARRKKQPLPLLQDHHTAARLGPWPLLDQHALAPGVVHAAAAQHAGQLERKVHLAVEILVQAVVPVFVVSEEERRGLVLA